MKKLFKRLLLLVLIFPCVFLCGCNEPASDPQPSPPPEEAPKTYSLEVSVNDETYYDYDKTSNTISLTYGQVLLFDETQFVVTKKWEDGSSFLAYSETAGEDKYTISSEFIFNEVNNAGTYKLSFNNGEDLNASINIKVNPRKVNIPVLSTNTFVYDGTTKFIEGYFQNYYGDGCVIDYENSTIENTDAGNYLVKFKLSDKANYIWQDETTEDKLYNWSITPKVIAVPSLTSATNFTYKDEFVVGENKYEGIPQSITIDYKQNESLFEIYGDPTTKTGVGPYKTVVRLKDQKNYILANGRTDIGFDWCINPKTIEAPTLEFLTTVYKDEFSNGLVGVSQTNSIVYLPNSESLYVFKIMESHLLTQTDVGTYTVVIGVKDERNYCFNGGAKTITLTWDITKKEIEKPALADVSLSYKDKLMGSVYGGVEQAFGFAPNNYTLLFKQTGGDSFRQTNVGYYSATLTLQDTKNYKLAGTKDISFEVHFNITPKVLTAPTASVENPRFTYNKQAHKPTLLGIEAIKLYIKTLSEGEVNASPNALSYIVGLKDEYKANYVWSATSTSEDLSFSYYIDRKEIDFTGIYWETGAEVLGGIVTQPYYIGAKVYMAMPYLEALYESDDFYVNFAINGNMEMFSAGEVGQYTSTFFLEYDTHNIRLIHYQNGEKKDWSIEEFGINYTWNIKPLEVDFSDVSWSYPELQHIGVEKELPVLEGKYTTSLGSKLENLPEFLTAKFDYVYTYYKYNPVSMQFEETTSLKEEGLYKAVAKLVYKHTYDGDDYNLAGTIVTEEVLGNSNFISTNLPTLETKFYVGKIGIDLRNTKWDSSEFIYSGEAQAPVLTNIPEGVTVTGYVYYNEQKEVISKPTEAGTYFVEPQITFNEEDYQLLNKPNLMQEFKINKKEIVVGALALVQNRFTYTGETISPEFNEETTPAGTRFVNLSGIIHMDEAGTYEVFVMLEAIDNKNYFVQDLIRLEWHIEKAQINAYYMNWAELPENGFTYDGQEKIIQMQNVPEKLAIDYIIKYKTTSGYVVIDKIINAGEYLIEPVCIYDQINYEVINNSVQPLKVVVEKQTIDASTFIWGGYDEPQYYTGEEIKPIIINIPSYVQATYLYTDNLSNEATPQNAGFYVARAEFSVLDANFTLSANYVVLNYEIKKGIIDMSGVSWSLENDASFAYDGQEHKAELLNLPANVNATYEYLFNGETATGFTSVGSYYTLATLIYDSVNYELVFNDLSRSWIIDKALLDTTSLYWSYDPQNPFVYDGNRKRVYLLGAPEGVNVAYSIKGYGVGLDGPVYWYSNEATTAGEHETTAILTSDDYQTTEVKLVWQILKGYINTSYYSLIENLFGYTTETHTVSLNSGTEGEDWVRVKNTTAVNAGVYEAEFLIYAYDENTLDTTVTLSWEIEKAIVRLNGARWELGEDNIYSSENNKLVYNGTKYTPEFKFDRYTGLHDLLGVTVTYKNAQGQVIPYLEEVGEYTVTSDIDNNPNIIYEYYEEFPKEITVEVFKYIVSEKDIVSNVTFVEKDGKLYAECGSEQLTLEFSCLVDGVTIETEVLEGTLTPTTLGEQNLRLKITSSESKYYDSQVFEYDLTYTLCYTPFGLDEGENYIYVMPANFGMDTVIPRPISFFELTHLASISSSDAIIFSQFSWLQENPYEANVFVNGTLVSNENFEFIMEGLSSVTIECKTFGGVLISSVTIPVV